MNQKNRILFVLSFVIITNAYAQNNHSKYGVVFENTHKSQKNQLIWFLDSQNCINHFPIDKYMMIRSTDNDYNKYRENNIELIDSLVAVFKISNIFKKKDNYIKHNDKLSKVTIYFIDVVPIIDSKLATSDSFYSQNPEHIRIISIQYKKSKMEEVKIGNNYKLKLYSYFKNNCCISNDSSGKVITKDRKPNEFLSSYFINCIWVPYINISDFNIYWTANLDGLYYIPSE